MKGIYNEKMDEGLAQVKKEALPAEVTRGVNDIYVHYKKYMDVQDVEENTFEKRREGERRETRHSHAILR